MASQASGVLGIKKNSCPAVSSDNGSTVITDEVAILDGPSVASRVNGWESHCELVPLSGEPVGMLSL